MPKQMRRPETPSFLPLILAALLLPSIPASLHAANPATAPIPFQLKGARIMKGLLHSGWVIPADAGNADVPEVTPVAFQTANTGKSAEIGPLTGIAEKVLETGEAGKLPARFCIALGISTSEEPCPLHALSVNSDRYKEIIMAGARRDGLDIILIYRTNTAATFFLTSTKGQLLKAIHVESYQQIQYPSLDEVRADFEREKAFWIERLK